MKHDLHFVLSQMWHVRFIRASDRKDIYFVLYVLGLAHENIVDIRVDVD